jgi:hypothetical protein
MEASSQIRQASQNQLLASVSARVITRAFGLRLGGFGVDYTSKQVLVDPEGQTERKQADTAGQAFNSELDRDNLREQVFDASWREAVHTPEPAPTHPDPVWRKGLQAYARARDMLLAESARAARTKLAVA